MCSIIERVAVAKPEKASFVSSTCIRSVNPRRHTSHKLVIHSLLRKPYDYNNTGQSTVGTEATLVLMHESTACNITTITTLFCLSPSTGKPKNLCIASRRCNHSSSRVDGWVHLKQIRPTRVLKPSYTMTTV